MADCAPPFARPAFRDTFSRFFLFLFALRADVAAPAAARVPVVVRAFTRGIPCETIAH